jgi:hypothetical protein
VLGWVKWRELESLYGLGAIRAMLELAIEEGDLAAGSMSTRSPMSYSLLLIRLLCSSRMHPSNVRPVTKASRRWMPCSTGCE